MVATGKKEKKKRKKLIAALASEFDQASFSTLVAAEEAQLRVKTIQEGPSRRLLRLEKDYRSRETAFLVLAEEKIRYKIRRKEKPDENQSTAKTMARHDTYMANMSRRPKHTMYGRHNYDDDRPVVDGGMASWRGWGHG